MSGQLTVGFAVIGAGRIGALHALNAARHTPFARLVWVARLPRPLPPSEP